MIPILWGDPGIKALLKAFLLWGFPEGQSSPLDFLLLGCVSWEILNVPQDMRIPQIQGSSTPIPWDSPAGIPRAALWGS